MTGAGGSRALVTEGDTTSGYKALMPYRVRDILLVASSYDSFILEQDGSFGDQLLAQYLELSLETAPRFHWVSSQRAALKHLEGGECDMGLTTPQFAGGSSGVLAEQIKEANPQIHWLRIVWAFAADHCSVRGHFLSHDSVFGDYACDVAVEFDPRWEDDKLVVPMSVAARSEFRRFTRREVGRDDLVDTDERICNVSIPAGTFVFEQVDDGLMLINESTGEALHLIPTDFDPAYTWRLPSP